MPAGNRCEEEQPAGTDLLDCEHIIGLSFGTRMKLLVLIFVLGLTPSKATTIVLRGIVDRPQSERQLVAALAELKGRGGEVVLDGGTWIIRKEVRLPSGLILRGTNNALLRLPSPRLVTTTAPISARQLAVSATTEFRVGDELAVLPPGEGKNRITTIRIADLDERTVKLAKSLETVIPAGSRIGYSHRMFLGYAVTNVSLLHLIIDGGRNADIPMPGHHLRSAIWISAPYNYEKGPIGPPAANISVSDCTITNCYGRAVAFYHTVDSQVTNCSIGGLKDEGIDFDHFAFRCRAIGNTIDGATIGVELNDASDCLVQRNHIRNTHIGVRIWWYDKFDPAGLNTRNLIEDNHITSVSRAAIYLGRNCTENRIRRNTVDGKIEADRKLNELLDNRTN